MSGASATKSAASTPHQQPQEKPQEKPPAAANSNQPKPVNGSGDVAAPPAGTDPAFDKALQTAQRDRAKADGATAAQRGNEVPHQIKPGESLYEISQDYRAPFSDVLKANKQLRDPNRVHPGDIAFVPNADPRVVTARSQVAEAHRAEDSVASLESMARDPKSTPSSRKLANMELEGARNEVSRRWGEVQTSVENDLRAAGAGKALPDEASKPALAEIRGRVPDDPQYQATVDKARANVEAKWKQTGATRAELDGLIGDAQTADRNVASMEAIARDPSTPPGERKLANADLPDARNAAGTAWTNVQTEIANQFRSLGTGKPYPEEVIQPQVEALRNSLPNDPKVQSAIDTATSTVTDEWRKQGWTRDTLGTINAQYDTVRQMQGEVDAARASGQGDLAGLETRLSNERTALRQEIERQLDDVAGQVPPEQREMAIGARAALIEQNGANEAAFKDIVDQAAYNKRVQPGVDAVTNAYRTGGAKAAAETLRQQTESVSQETAERIVAASLPTVDSIAADMKRSLTEGGPIEYQDVAGVYANVATATDYAARGNDGAQVTADVARTMLRHLPSEKFQPHFQDSPAYPLPAYQEAVMQSVSGGTGATLALEMTAQLKDAGRVDEADSLLSATQTGVSVLQGKIKDDVTAFGEATGEISRLRADWDGVMSPEQLDTATIEYVSKRPDLVPNFDRTYNAVDGLGYGAVRTSMALNSALPRLQGLPTAERFNETRNEFVGSKEVQFAMGLSDKGSNEVLRIVLGEEAGTLTPNANPNSSVSSTRGFVKELANALMTSQPSSSSAVADLGAATATSIPSAGSTAAGTAVRDIFGTGQNVNVDPKKVTPFLGGMNGLGAAFNGYQAALAWDKFAKDPGHLLNATKAVYYTIGAGKETAELLAVGAQRGWLGLSKLPGADRVSTSILAKANRTGLAMEPGWVKFSTYFKIGGGLIDGAYAIDAAAKRDWIASGLYATSASGGFMMAAGSVAASGGWLATWGGPAGAGLVLASAVGLYFYNDAKDKSQFEGPSREFLQAAGFRPEIAEAMSDYDNNDGGSAGPALAATARQFGITPEQLMESLKRADPEKVRDLIEQAHTVDQNDAGQFSLTAGNDRNVWAPPGKDPEFGGQYLYDPQDHRFRGEYRAVPGSWYPARMEDPNPRSMTALRDYARVLFGANVLG